MVAQMRNVGVGEFCPVVQVQEVTLFKNFKNMRTLKR